MKKDRSSHGRCQLPKGGGNQGDESFQTLQNHQISSPFASAKQHTLFTRRCKLFKTCKITFEKITYPLLVQQQESCVVTAATWRKWRYVSIKQNSKCKYNAVNNNRQLNIREKYKKYRKKYMHKKVYIHYAKICRV